MASNILPRVCLEMSAAFLGGSAGSLHYCSGECCRKLQAHRTALSTVVRAAGRRRRCGPDYRGERLDEGGAIIRPRATPLSLIAGCSLFPRRWLRRMGWLVAAAEGDGAPIGGRRDRQGDARGGRVHLRPAHERVEGRKVGCSTGSTGSAQLVSDRNPYPRSA
jgi:hypothetical protein